MLQFPEARLSCLTHSRARRGAVGKPPGQHSVEGVAKASLLQGTSSGCGGRSYGEKKWSSLMICRWRCAPEVFQLEVPLVNTSLREVTEAEMWKGLQHGSLPSQQKACVQQKRPEQEASNSLQTCGFRSSLAKSCPTHHDRAHCSTPGLPGALALWWRGLVGSMKLWAMPCGPPSMDESQQEFWQRKRSIGGPINSIKRQKEVSTGVWNWGSKRNKAIQGY